MRTVIAGKKGQVLVISVAVVFIIFIFVIAVVEAGNLMYEKTHMQNIADSGAMEGGMWYARGMNMLALSNKILAITGIAAIIAGFAGAPEAGIKAVEFVQKAQDLIAGTGEMEKSGIKAMPIFCAAAVVLNGSDNKACSLPLFNLKDFDQSKWMPSFNVKRRYADDLLDSGEDNDRYYYTNGKTGERVYVDKESVRYDSGINNRKDLKDMIMTKNDPIHGTKFLKREEGNLNAAGLVPLDIIESSDEHSVLVLSFKNNAGQVTGSGFFKDKNGNEIKPAVLMSSSFVRIQGGKLGIFEPDGANYEPRLEHIEFPEINTAIGLKDIMGQAAQQAKNGYNPEKISGYLSSAVDLFNSGIILH